MIRLFLLPIVALTSVLTVESSALACKCAPPLQPKKALKEATAVFSGKVVKIEIDKKTRMNRVSVEVEHVWKGIEKKKVVVQTFGSGITCGYGFKVGESYLIYCFRSDQLSTNICTRTKPLDKAGDDIKELGEGKKVELLHDGILNKIKALNNLPEWSGPVNGLLAKIKIEKTKVKAGEEMEVQLFVRAENPDKRYPKLLQGQIIFTFAPFGPAPFGPAPFGANNKALASVSRKFFSGGGNIDYTGEKSITYRLVAPQRPGHYFLFATVLSSSKDVRAFLIVARINPGAGPWWTGALTTSQIDVGVEGSALPQVIKSAQGLLKYYPSNVKSSQAWHGHNFIVGGTPILPTKLVPEDVLKKARWKTRCC